MSMALVVTISKPSTANFTHQPGGYDEFAAVTVLFEPLPRDSGIAFENRCDGLIPQPFVVAVEHGVRAQCREGIGNGLTLTDLRAVLVDAGTQDGRSTTATFEAAARGAVFRLARQGVLATRK